MLLRSILLKTLRDQRWPALAWGGGLGALLVISAAGWARAFPDAASRRQIALQVESGLSAVQVIFGEPHNVDQLGGFLAWRILSIYPVMLGLFLVIAATGASRGAEERGETAVVLLASRGRGRMIAQQAAGLGLALVAAGALIWAALLVCGPVAGEPVLSPARAALAVLNVGLSAALFGAAALLVAQFASTRRAAALAAGVALFASHLWSNLGLIVPPLRGVRRLSPLFLTSLSTPLADGHTDPMALALLAVLTCGCVLAAGWLFARRDLESVVRVRVPAVAAMFLWRWTSGGARPGGRLWLLRNPIGRGLRTSLPSAMTWGVALGVYAALFTALTPAVQRALEEQVNAQSLIEALRRGGFTSTAGVLNSALFSLLPVLLAMFAATLAIAWSAEERAGRLELELTAPVPRRRYFVERVGAALLAVLIVVALAGAGLLIAAFLARLDLPVARTLAAVALLVPLAGVVAAFGFALSAWRPDPVAAILTPALAVSFFLDLLAPLFDLPDAVRNLSVFRLYGQPLIAGVDWERMAVLLALIALFTLTGSVAFARRDIVK
jgi:ABC-2 type transport system permease protein